MLNDGGLTTYHCKTDVFKYSFFLYTISEWNKLNLHVRKVRSIQPFKNALFKTGRPIPSPYFNIYHPVRLKLLNRLGVGLSHLNEHKFKHNFSNCVYVTVVWKLNESSIFFSTVSVFLTFIKSSLINWIHYVIILLVFQITVRLTYFIWKYGSSNFSNIDSQLIDYYCIHRYFEIWLFQREFLIKLFLM